MALRVRFLVAAVLASCCTWTCHGDAVAFFDSTAGSYLKPGAPSRLSVDGYEALQAALANKPPTFDVSKSTSDEVAAFLVSDTFHRPAAKWNVLLFGATPSELFKETNDATAPVKVVDLYGTPAAHFKRNHKRVSSNSCGMECWEADLGALAERVGGSYEKGQGILDGVVGLKKSGLQTEALKLDGTVLSFWVLELSSLWRDLVTNLPARTVPMDYETTLTGLYLIRRDYGQESHEFKFAACFTEAVLKEVHRTLATYYNGQVFTSILLHVSSDAVKTDEGLDEAIVARGRSLLNVFSDSDPSKTVEEKVKRFSSNTVGYVMFLIMFFFSLGSIYAMANMDFTKDTLLYSQAKVD